LVPKNALFIIELSHFLGSDDNAAISNQSCVVVGTLSPS